MTQITNEQALTLIEQALNAGLKAGAYSFKDAALIDVAFTKLQTLAIKVETPEPVQ